MNRRGLKEELGLVELGNSPKQENGGGILS